MTATFYPTLTAFLDATSKMNEGERPTSQMAMEAFILNLLLRWQMEDEGVPPTDPTLIDVNKELGELSVEMTDDERGAVMKQLILWITQGDGWLADYISRTKDIAVVHNDR